MKCYDILCAILAKHKNATYDLPKNMLRVFRFRAGVILSVIALTWTASAQLSVTQPVQNVQNVNAGATVTFTVDVHGASGTPIYQWEFLPQSPPPNFPTPTVYQPLSDNPPPPWNTWGTAYSGSTSATLTLNGVHAQDNGHYRCVVTDATGTQVLSARPQGSLTVGSGTPFSALIVPTSQTVNAGDTATFEVEVTGQAGVLSYNWRYSPDNVPPYSNTISQERVLQLNNVQQNNAGYYRVRVFDTVAAPSGVPLGPATLTVNSTLPDFTLSACTPQPVTVQQGGSATCAITVNPKNGFSDNVTLNLDPSTPLPAGVTSNLSNGSQTTSSNSFTLQLQAATNAPTTPPPGVTVTINGTAPSVSTPRVVSLSVEVVASGPGPAVSGPMNTFADPGETAIFKVVANGTGTITYHWQMQDATTGNWVEIPSDPRITGINNPILEIAGVQASDAGQYRCQVTDQTGTNNPGASLSVGNLNAVERPDGWLQELYNLIQNHRLLGTYDWQLRLNTNGLDPFGVLDGTGNGKNKSVASAAVGLWYGPKMKVRYSATPSPTTDTDYRCWWDAFLKVQTGQIPPDSVPPGSDGNRFQSNELGSWDYSGVVEASVAAAYEWASRPDMTSQPGVPPPSCVDSQNQPIPGVDGSASSIMEGAKEYLRNAIGLSLMGTADTPPQNAFGVTGYVNGNADPLVLTSPPYDQPDQFFSPPNFPFPASGPFIAVAGQRTLAGFWANDQRQRILCLARNKSCSVDVGQPGASCLLQGNVPNSLCANNGAAVQSNLWSTLFSGTNVSLSAIDSFISDDPAQLSTDFPPGRLVGKIKAIDNLELHFLLWRQAGVHVRGSCMNRQTESSTDATLGVVYWPQGGSLSAGKSGGIEADFLYDGCPGRGCTNGATCTISNAVDQFTGTDSGRIRSASDPIPTTLTPNRTLHLPSGAPDIHYVLDQAGFHQWSPQATASVAFTPAGGTYTVGQSVTLADTTPGATIYYTIDGSQPTTSSQQYQQAIPVTSGTTINVLVTAPGYSNSIGSATYVLQTAMPTFNPATGTYYAGQQVSISDSTSGSTIYYTTDGSTPTTASNSYHGAITVNSTTTINAIAIAPGFISSPVASATYTIPTPDFSISATPASQTVVACGNTSYTATVSPINGFTGNVSLGLSGVLMGGGTETFNPASVTGSGSSTLAVTTSSSTAAATYALTITGTSGGLNRYNTVNIVVQDFAISATPNSQTLVAGQNTTYTVSTSPGNGGFSFNTGFSVSGLPTGATATFSPASLSGTGSSTLTVSTASSTPPGTYTLTITAASGCLTHTATMTLAVSAYAAAPVISPAGGTYNTPQTVTLSTSTPGGYIHYTTDGSYPTSASALYNGPITVNSAAILNAITIATGYYNSSESGANFNFQAATPVISPAGGTYNATQSVTITDSSPGVAIHYTTDGSTPTASSALYSGPITVSSSATITAIATNTGWQNSATASVTYTLLVATPVISPAGGTYSAAQSVTITDATPGAAIHYTMDGTTPTATSTVYSGPIAVSSTTTIRALATAAGFNNSGVAGATYTYLNQPNDAQFISQSVPATMAAGQKYNVSVTMKNVGANTWNTSQYKLGAQNPQDNTTWGLNRVLLSAPVANGSQVTFNFTVTAPAAASTYNFQWRMVQEGVQWFGGFTTNTQVQTIIPTVQVNGLSSSAAFNFGPPNTIAVQGSVSPIGFGTVQMVWRDATVNGAWNTVAAQATPGSNGLWYNTIPSSNLCHTYLVYAIYAGVTSSTYTFNGLTSGACPETASISWIQTAYAVGLNPPNSLFVEGKASGAPAGTQVTIWWSDITVGTPWTQGGSSSDGTWFINIPNVTYSHQYSVYAIYDAYKTSTCTYSGDGVGGTCP